MNGLFIARQGLISSEALWKIATYSTVAGLSVSVLISRGILNRRHWPFFPSETDEHKEERRLTTAEKRCELFENHSSSTKRNCNSNSNSNNNNNSNSNNSDVKGEMHTIHDENMTSSPEVDGDESSQVSEPLCSQIQTAAAAAAVATTTITQRHHQNHITSLSPASSRNVPPLKSTAEHPGLTSFHLWQDAIASIYRVYNMGASHHDIVVPPQPKSERGYVSVHLQIYNRTSRDIDVYWLNYKGNEDHRGILLANGGSWNQSTWIGHPWVFRDALTQRIVLHYIPYRVIPTTERAVTVSVIDRHVGIHAFSFVRPPLVETDSLFETDEQHDACLCAIEDRILPYPSNKLTTIEDAVKFSICQMEREQISPHILLKYLYKIIQHPEDSKYRQIRTSNAAFWKNVWCNGGRGVLHALGFVENGSYVEMGPPSHVDDRGEGSNVLLSLERQRHVFDAIFLLENHIADSIDNVDGGGFQQQQPRGADGTGRAGYRQI